MRRIRFVVACGALTERCARNRPVRSGARAAAPGGPVRQESPRPSSRRPVRATSMVCGGRPATTANSVLSTASCRPFTERGRREWERNVKADERRRCRSRMRRPACLPHGIPRLLASPYPIQIITVGNQMTWVHEVNRNQRFIYMGESHPANLKKTYLGHSVGPLGRRYPRHRHRSALNDKTRIDEEGITHSDQLHVVERIRKVEIDRCCISKASSPSPIP